MQEVDVRLQLQVAEELARGYARQVAEVLLAKGWAVHCHLAGDQPLSLVKPLVHARRDSGKVLVVFRPTGELVTMVEQVRPLADTPAGEDDDPKSQERRNWHVVMSSSCPTDVVLATAELAAHDPHDLRLDEA